MADTPRTYPWLEVDHPLNRSVGLDPEEFAGLDEETIAALRMLSYAAYFEPS
jgi:hypothetical protein